MDFQGNCTKIQAPSTRIILLRLYRAKKQRDIQIITYTQYNPPRYAFPDKGRADPAPTVVIER